jgi:membrane protein DedA with SNARE-associated domain
VVEAVADIVAWMEGLRPAWIYASLFAVAFIENVVPPLPGDLLVVFGGYLVGVGTLSFAPTVLVATIGGTLGFMTLYTLGLRVGAAILDVDRMRWVPKRAARRAVAWLGRYGYAVVAANRFLSGGRSVISMAAGAARLKAVPTALWATVSGIAWCSLLVSVGYLVGDQWGVIGRYLALYGRWVTVATILVAIVWIGLRARRRWQDRLASEEAAKTP